MHRVGRFGKPKKDLADRATRRATRPQRGIFPFKDFTNNSTVSSRREASAKGDGSRQTLKQVALGRTVVLSGRIIEVTRRFQRTVRPSKARVYRRGL